MLRQLLDPTKSKRESSQGITKILHKPLLIDKEIEDIKNRYLYIAPQILLGAYKGKANTTMDRPIKEAEVRATMQLCTASVPGKIGITKKMLRNPSDASVTAITRYRTSMPGQKQSLRK